LPRPLPYLLLAGDFPSFLVRTHRPLEMAFLSLALGVRTLTILSPPRFFFFRASAAEDATTAVFLPEKKKSFLAIEKNPGQDMGVWEECAGGAESPDEGDRVTLSYCRRRDEKHTWHRRIFAAPGR